KGFRRSRVMHLTVSHRQRRPQAHPKASKGPERALLRITTVNWPDAMSENAPLKMLQSRQ
ncbi:MAG: hypothetical protein H6Q05_4460, partial [Acidobacteria bacterium]|nr:hypothetical protein [Acidobacteriota bacterium]